MNLRKLLSVYRTISGIVVAFILSFWAARQRSNDRESRSSYFSEERRIGPVSAAVQNPGREVIGGRSWVDAKVKLVKSWEASPAVEVDFALREETQRLLEKVSNEDLEAWLRQLRPGTRDEDSSRDIQYQLREMVMQVLAPRAGGALIRSFVENPAEGGSEDIGEAMGLWSKQDPSEVLMWLDGNVPDGIKDDLADFREDALVELARKDPVEFEARLAGVDQDVRESVLERYAYRRRTSEESAGILTRAARSPHGEAMALWMGLIRGKGVDDLRSAEETLKELEVSDKDRAALDEALVESLLGGYHSSEEDSSEVMQGWVERNSGRELPEGVLDSFKNWSRHQPEKAVELVSSLPPGLQYDAFAQWLIRERAGETVLDHPAAAQMSARISDTAIRLEAERKIKDGWQSKDPPAASEWEQSLPASDRERLKQEP